MKKLKNEMAAIIERSGLMESTPIGNMVICCTANGKYEFPADMTGEILRRAGDMRNTPKINLMDTSNRTQARLAYMKQNPLFLQALFTIRKLMKEMVPTFTTYGTNQAVKCLIRNYPSLKEHFATYITSYDAAGRIVSVQSYLDLLPIVPKAWINNIKL